MQPTGAGMPSATSTQPLHYTHPPGQDEEDDGVQGQQVEEDDGAGGGVAGDEGADGVHGSVLQIGCRVDGAE